MTPRLRVTLGSALCVELADLSDHEILEIERALTLPNPKAKHRPGADRRFNRVPPYLYYFERVGDRLELPRGALAALAGVCGRFGRQIELRDERVAPATNRWRLRRAVRPYQEIAAIELAKQEQGILVGPCGLGKGTVAFRLMTIIGVTTLVLVGSTDLLEQWTTAVRELLDVEAVVCAEGHVGLGPITVGMIQTISDREEWLCQAADYFGAVIVDECHHVAAESYRRVVHRMRAKYRIGLTATPERADGLTRAVQFLLGPIVHEIGVDELEREGVALRPERRVIETSFAFDYVGPTDWPRLLSALEEDEARNALIVDVVARECTGGVVGLLLTNRVALAESYADRLAARGVRAAALTGKTSRRLRGATLDAARAGELQVIVATQLADEGLDVPRLSRAFLTAPSRSEARLVQRIGRILRPHPGKGPAIVFDFVDLVGPLEYQARIRQRVWRDTWGQLSGAA